MNRTSLVTSGPRPAVRLERDLRDPPAVVWQALTDREQLVSWFPCEVVVADGHWRVGSAITFVFSPDVADLTLNGKVLAVDEPNLLMFSWGEEILRFELSPADGGTHLVLLDELPAGHAARNAAGWEACLDRLAGVEPDQTEWEPSFAAYSAAFEPIIGPQEGPPEDLKEN